MSKLKQTCDVKTLGHFQIMQINRARTSNFWPLTKEKSSQIHGFPFQNQCFQAWNFTFLKHFWIHLALVFQWEYQATTVSKIIRCKSVVGIWDSESQEYNTLQNWNCLKPEKRWGQMRRSKCKRSFGLILLSTRFSGADFFIQSSRNIWQTVQKKHLTNRTKTRYYSVWVPALTNKSHFWKRDGNGPEMSVNVNKTFRKAIGKIIQQIRVVIFDTKSFAVRKIIFSQQIGQNKLRLYSQLKVAHLERSDGELHVKSKLYSGDNLLKKRDLAVSILS